MIEYLKIIYFYKSTLFTVIRLLFLFFLSSLISFEIARHEFPNLLIFLLLLFIILDIFVIFKIGHIRPKLKISENDQKDIFKSFTERTLYLFFIKKNIIVLLNALLNLETARFMLDKLNVEKKELPVIEIQTKDLASLSFQVAQKANGKFVTTMDVLTAYLQLVEPQTHLLFNKKIKLEDLLKILIWARFVFGYEENPSKWRINFNGDSVGEWLTTGWTLETKRYSQDLTNKALKKRPLLVGRAEEFKQILEGLSKKENNNIIIVGERGTGKDAIVEALAYKSFCGELPENLNHKRIYELLVGALLAGATNQGELENRIKVIIDEISHAKNVMVYIPEFENVLGASSFGINLSGALMPYLKDGKLPIIAAMTPENYKQYVENKSLLEVFTTIKLEEPNKNTVLEMIFDKAADIEKNNRLSLTYLSIMAAIEFSYRYLGGRKLPGGAISLLEDASSNAFLAGKKRLEEEDVIKTLESKMNISIAEPKTEEKELLLRLEEKLHQRIIDQNEAIFLISESMRRLRTGFISANKPVSFLFLGPTGVGKTETAKALADLYFKGEGNMIRLDMSEYTGEDGVRRLLGAPPGAGEEKGELTEKIYDNPCSLVLLDEFEKANPKIHDLFLQVFDDGRLTDNKGKTVSFINSIIIATSNAASEFIREEVNKGTLIDERFHRQLLDYLQANNIFKPELLNRFDAVVTFKPLGKEEVIQIIKLMMESLVKKLSEQDIVLTYDDKVVKKVASEGYNREYGARPLRRFIQDNIEDLLARKKLEEEIKRGSIVTLTIDDLGNIAVNNSSGI